MEDSSTDDFVVAMMFGESSTDFALAFPTRWDGGHVSVVKALALGPDAGVEDSDYDVVIRCFLGPYVGGCGMGLCFEAEE